MSWNRNSVPPVTSRNVTGGNEFAHDLRRKAHSIIDECTISGGQPA